jgi:hypothetical protein
MNRCKNLVKLRLTLGARLDRLERKLGVTINLPSHEQDPIVAYVTIEALNAWAAFSKAFYLSCVINAKNESRSPVTVHPLGMSENDAVGHAILLFKRHAIPNSTGQWSRRDEPAWHDPNVLLQICKGAKCSQYAQIQAAFSLGQRVFHDLPVFRNFYGHRNRLSAAAAQNIAPRYLLPTNLRPSELLLRSKPSAVSSILSEWIDELRITSEFLCH